MPKNGILTVDRPNAEKRHFYWGLGIGAGYQSTKHRHELVQHGHNLHNLHLDPTSINFNQLQDACFRHPMPNVPQIRHHGEHGDLWEPKVPSQV